MDRLREHRFEWSALLAYSAVIFAMIPLHEPWRDEAQAWLIARDLDLVGYGESAEAMMTFGSSVLRFVRQGRWKYIHKLEPELYDLSWDHAEGSDLAPHRPELVDRFTRELEGFVQAAGVAGAAGGSTPGAATVTSITGLAASPNSPRRSISREPRIIASAPRSRLMALRASW